MAPTVRESITLSFNDVGPYAPDDAVFWRINQGAKGELGLEFYVPRTDKKGDATLIVPVSRRDLGLLSLHIQYLWDQGIPLPGIKSKTNKDVHE